MLSIGEFAFHGQVSVRMLRHYDRLGLLRPARVDPFTGYRSYTAEQLSRLNRLVALKDLGFTLEQIGPVLDGRIGADELRGMLTLRQAQIADQVQADRARLGEIARRLRAIEKETVMSDLEFVEKPLPALTLSQLTAHVDEHHEIGPAVGPLFGRLIPAAEAAGVDVAQPSYAWYTSTEDGIELGVGLPLEPGGTPIPGTTPGGLQEAPRALTVVHHGDMASIGESWQALVREAEARGLTLDGPCRELYLDTSGADQAGWVTELQQPVH